MTKVAVRLARVAALVPPPAPLAPDLDVSRLTPDQMMRMAKIQPRYLALGLAGLTDDEVEFLAQMAELLRAPELAEVSR